MKFIKLKDGQKKILISIDTIKMLDWDKYTGGWNKNDFEEPIVAQINVWFKDSTEKVLNIEYTNIDEFTADWNDVMQKLGYKED